MTYFYITNSSDDLQHHGILGQKWGVRRFQNKDGSYTSAGRKRYGESDKKKDYTKLASRKFVKLSKNAYKEYEKEDPNIRSKARQKTDEIVEKKMG